MNEFEIKFKNSTGHDFKKFYNEHRPKLAWHLSTFTKDLEVAEDFADEAFMQGLEKIDQYHPEKGAQIHTWIYTIGRHLVIKEFKDKQRLPVLSLDAQLDDNTSLSSFVYTDEPSIRHEEEMITSTKGDLIRDAIMALPDKYKEVIVMRELQNMPYKDIADSLQRNLSTVKSQIKKGRYLINKKVEKQFISINKNGIK